MKDLITLLHKKQCSLVLKNGAEIRVLTRRGVIDLFELYNQEPSIMKGASIADKVIGKGAAALMVLGEVTRVYADIISTEALYILRYAGIEIEYAREVPFIINRTNTGRCPLETACEGLLSPNEMYPIIEQFVNRNINK